MAIDANGFEGRCGVRCSSDFLSRRECGEGMLPESPGRTPISRKLSITIECGGSEIENNRKQTVGYKRVFSTNLSAYLGTCRVEKLEQKVVLSVSGHAVFFELSLVSE